MTALFGTDGIRGTANQYPITCEIALHTGRAVGAFAKDRGFDSVVIGKDTRISGNMLAAAAASGLASAGVHALMAGTIPTPGLAYLAREIKDAGAGIMISASHNPYTDNGIKLFLHNGSKLTDAEEKDIEKLIMSPPDVRPDAIADIIDISDRKEMYTHFLIRMFSKWKHRDRHPDTASQAVYEAAPGPTVVIDCSNGAASEIAKAVFTHPFIKPIFINDCPDGKNINLNCGSQHLTHLIQTVLTNQADLGLAFDGDADRLIAVDENGNPITGDTLLAIYALFFKKNNILSNNTVVSTIMSNVGLSHTLTSQSIRHIITDVGDRKVIEIMEKENACLGGEDSGHLIFKNDHTTGDGMLSAIKLIQIMAQTEKSASALASVMTTYPQVLMNIEVDKSKPDIMKIPAIAQAVQKVEARLSDQGRVLIRYSGTQPLLRVMVEGPDMQMTQSFADQLCQVIKAHI